jgi:putative ABC transport system permease protein
MIRNYLKIAIRNFIRQKIISTINVTGLAIGFVCIILILIYVQYEFSYESHHKNANNIYRVNIIQKHPNREFKLSHSMVPLGPTLKDEIPDVQDFTRIEDAGKSLISYQDKKFYENDLIFADQGIFNLFSIPIVSGNKGKALTSKFSVVITKSIADKFFSDKDPVGQQLQIDNDILLTVTAVIEDFPENTHIKADYIISFNTLRDLTSESFFNNWVTTRLETFILIEEPQRVARVEKKAIKVMNAHSSTEVERSLEFEQFSRIHLYSDVTKYGDIHYIYLFLSIGVLILIIASINFMNLSTARSSRRANEVGLRKVVGATKLQLIKQFLGESILTTFLALAAALIIVKFTLPIFRTITDQKLDFPTLSDWHIYGTIIIITIAVGLLSGGYPALYLSAFSPINILKGSKSSVGKATNLRRLLVVFQFTIAIALIITTLLIGQQIDYMRNKNLGFQKDQIVVVPVSGDVFRENTDHFKQQLLQNPNIKSATGSFLLPSRIRMYNNVTWEGAAENESIALIQNKVDYDFLDTYEIKIIQGRNFSREYISDIADYDRKNINGAIILNEEAVRRFGWENPINKKVIQTFGTQRYFFNVVGVIKDFHFSSLHYKIDPLSLFLRPADPRQFSIKIGSVDIQNTIAYIRETWNVYNPKFPFEYYFLDETYERTYHSEEKVQTLFRIFSLISIFISFLGLFGLSVFAAEQRTKEIGVRKVLGASISNILLLLSKEFTQWILVANIIAWPVAWIFIHKWLGNFAYRIDIDFWIFILSGFLALFIAILTVSWQAIRAATINPVEAIRYE